MRESSLGALRKLRDAEGAKPWNPDDLTALDLCGQLLNEQ